MKTIILLFIFTHITAAQNQFQEFIQNLYSQTDSINRNLTVDSFMVYARTQDIPFITGDSSNFIYRGSTNTIAVAGDFNSWNPSAVMIKIPLTNFWYYSRAFEPDARLDYKFVRNGSIWILDPENPHTVSGGFGPNSELAMPDYIQPWEINYNASIEHGTVINKTLSSSIAGSSYQLKIYLPPFYDSTNSAGYPSVYFQDGFEYVDLGSAVKVIDNLIDSNLIEPVVAVFVRPNDRNVEYAGNKRDQYRLFFVNELVPYIDSLFNTRKNKYERLVLGDSYGGNISALISYNHAEVFANCGLHSGAFQPNGYEVYNQIINGPVKDIKWYSVWGTYEGSLTNTMRQFRDFLLQNNYQLSWEERHEGHSWGLWRATIDDILKYIFPFDPTGVDEETIVHKNFSLSQNYPNPFNPSTKISWQAPVSGWQTLRVYDILGREVATLVEEYKPAGSYEVEFNANELSSGIYFYQLKAGNYSSIKKMVLVK